MSKPLRIALLAASCAAAMGCTPEALGQIDSSFQASAVLMAPANPILQGVETARRLGRELAGAAVGLLGLYLWYLAHEGRPWVVVLKESFLGIALAGWVLSTAGTPLGVERWIFTSASFLQTQFAPEPALFQQAATGLVNAQTELFTEVVNRPMEDASDPAVRVAQAAAWFATQETSALFFWINGLGVLLIKEWGALAYVFVSGLSWVLLPLVAWTAILRPMRGVFFGWLRTYVAIALWPMLWGIADRIVLAMLGSTGFGLGGLDRGNLVDVVVALGRNQVMYALVNLATLGAYASVPVLSYKIVSGATSSLTSLAR